MEETENASLFQTNSSKNANQIMFIYRSIRGLAGRILAEQQVFACVSFSGSKVCLRFSMIRKPKDQSCVSKIGLFGEHWRDRSPSISFKTCRVPRFRLRCKCLCSMFFTQRDFTLVSTKYTKFELQTPSFSKSLFVGRISPFFLHCAEQKPCELKRVQILQFFYRKYFQWSQLNSRNSLVDDCQIVWTLTNWADCHSNNESPNCYRSRVCLSNESDKHSLHCYVSLHKATVFSCTVANDLWSLQMLVDFPFLCNWIFSH